MTVRPKTSPRKVLVIAVVAALVAAAGAVGVKLDVPQTVIEQLSGSQDTGE
jgi:hypothetical protein